MDLVQCPACTSPSLVPRTELTNHIAVLHQAEAFRCAVCKFSGLTVSFLTYETIKTHLVEAHRVTEESCLPSTILLPSNLLSWSCKICRDFRLKPSEQLVLQHIEQVHGGFFLAASSSSGGWWSAVCRVCDVEGTGEEIRLHEEQHRREGFAKEEKDGADEAATGSTGGSWVEDDQLTYQEAQTDLERLEVAQDSPVEAVDSEPSTDLLDEDPGEVNKDKPELEPETKKANVEKLEVAGEPGSAKTPDGPSNKSRLDSEEETNTKQEKFIEEYTEKICRFCHAFPVNQNNQFLSRNQFLRLGKRFITKSGRSPVFTFILGAIDIAKDPGMMDSGENKPREPRKAATLAKEKIARGSKSKERSKVIPTEMSRGFGMTKYLKDHMNVPQKTLLGELKELSESSQQGLDQLRKKQEELREQREKEDGSPSKKIRLEEIPDKISEEDNTDSEVEKLLNLDDDEFSLLVGTPAIEDDVAKSSKDGNMSNIERLDEDPGEVNEDEPELEPEPKKAKGSVDISKAPEMMEKKKMTEEKEETEEREEQADRTVTSDKETIIAGGKTRSVSVPNQGIKLIAFKGSEGGNAAKMTAQQKVQIVKSADGKLQVRGLLPGQQLVQMPDGRLQIFSSNTPVSGGTPMKTAKPTPIAGAAKRKVVGIQSLGSNTVTIKDRQLIVQGPDLEAATGIAKKLASEEAKIGNVNGKQVLVMMGQEEAPPTLPAAIPTQVQCPPVGGSVKPVTPLTSITVTAQLVQSGQGQKIILQGLQGVQLEQQQVTQIQQQVKTGVNLLLKQQSLARQEGKVPPNKVSFILTGNFTNKQN